MVAEGVEGEHIAPGERSGSKIGAQAAGVHEPDVRAQRRPLGIRHQVTQYRLTAG